MDVAIIAKYEGQRVPRYTSYPTAPHFGPAVGEAVYRRWLAAVPADTALSLYLHVPFCSSLCWYCGCHTKITRRYEPIADYLNSLRREIALVAGALPARMPVDQVHWGGGTPNILRPDDLSGVMAVLRQYFDIRPEAEIAIEVDPRTVTPAMVAALAAAGINRASLGVQTFDRRVQEAVHRVQPFAQSRDLVAALRAAGIARINFDLLYGLPYQTVESCIDTVDRALTLAPDRLAVFGYAHLPSLKRHQRVIEEDRLPDGRNRLEQLFAVADRLDRAGYLWIGLDHFARPDDPLALALQDRRLGRSFQGYAPAGGQSLIGFGASAIGTLPQGYVQNAVPLDAYGQALAARRLPTVRGIALTPEDRLRRDVIEPLMCMLAVDLAEVAARHGVSPAVFTEDLAALAPLQADGIVSVDGLQITVAPGFRPLVRSVAAVFDTYLQRRIATHAIAV